VITKKYWAAIGGLILLSALLVGFFSLQPSPEDLLLQALEALETINDAHMVVHFNLDTVEQQASGSVELWGRKGENGPGAFRLEVLETTVPELTGVVAVSDGETLWAYDPNVNSVLLGSLEEAMQMVEESDFFAEKQLEMENFDRGDYDPPESAEEAIQRLMEYFKVDNKGAENIGDNTAYLLKFVPIPEQMPAEFSAVGGFLNLWIDKDRNLPLAVEYTGGTLGQVNATVKSLEINTGLEDSLFTFEAPAEAEVMGFADIAPQSVSLEEAAGSAGFQILAPMELPEGATLVDILQIQGAIVQRYTLPAGGSFTIAQGITDEALPQTSESESVDVRGVSGRLYVDEGGNRVLLTWAEGDLVYSIAGDLTRDQTLLIAESLQ
jgi:outer membrane lipoprotein-sorting protein